MEFTIVKSYGRDDVNTTFKYDFTVPNETERLDAYIEVNQPPKPVEGQRPDSVGVGLMYDGVIRSWNCTHRKHLIVAEQYGSPGSLVGKIEPGTWQIVIMPRTKNEIQCVEVKIRIVITQKHRRYIVGDPHLHTYHSDGKLSADSVADIATSAGMDYIFITDHNISSSNYTLPCDKGILVGAGLEYGTEGGHALILGDTTPINDFSLDNTWSNYKKHLDEAHNNGASYGLNHPFCDDSPWRVGYDFDYDWVEVWNGRWSVRNEEALAWWHDMLVKGSRISAIGGSDCHCDGPHTRLGIPATYVSVNGVTADEIIRGYKKGHVYVMLYKDILSFDMHTTNSIIGDITDDSIVHIDIDKLMPDDKILIITDNKKMELTPKDSSFSYTFNRSSEKFIRVEVRRDIFWGDILDGFDYVAESVILLSNPIYFK